jgi:hypothetical protein
LQGGIEGGKNLRHPPFVFIQNEARKERILREKNYGKS